ncbi:uncharacterized protein LOC113777331 [Coffea eugenioides]|uniref:uncharacterized protein LOC113777331 n=2 Tax=Coffea eugenioides TaxID=49369 RepID=UPI000F605269|nr:uncharacterized protein LOC113777331 [Coffea eugenioides]
MALEMEIKELIAFSDSDLLVHQTLKQWITKDSKILPYHCSLLTLAKQFRNLEFRHLPRARNAFADALATLASMTRYPDELRIEPIPIQLQDKPAHCWVVDKSSDNVPWYTDLKEFLKTGSYPLHAEKFLPLRLLSSSMRVLFVNLRWVGLEFERVGFVFSCGRYARIAFENPGNG